MKSLKMKLLTITKNEISFGCMKAIDAWGNAAVVIIHPDRRGKHDEPPFARPNKGDQLACININYSVFKPIAKVNRAHLSLRSLPICSDILSYYFPPYEPICGIDEKHLSLLFNDG